MSRRDAVFLIWLLTLLALMSCAAQEEEAEPEPLPPAETFDWCAQPISFQPPPPKWYREKHQEAGLLGVRFTHGGSVGERVYIAEYYRVGQRSEREDHRVSYDLGDLVDQVRFDPTGFPEPDSFQINPMVLDTLFCGLPAYRVDFTWSHPERIYHGREFYFLRKNYLFVAAFWGLEENLALFERIMASVTFPDPVTP